MKNIVLISLLTLFIANCSYQDLTNNELEQDSIDLDFIIDSVYTKSAFPDDDTLIYEVRVLNKSADSTIIVKYAGGTLYSDAAETLMVGYAFSDYNREHSYYLHPGVSLFQRITTTKINRYPDLVISHFIVRIR